MDKLKFHKIILFFLLLSLAGLTHAQSKISVKASIDKNKVLIGERIQLSLEAVFPSNKDVHFFSIDSIPHFEIVQKGKTDTAKTTNGISLRQQLQLTSFDSGHWVIPAFLLDKKIKTDPIPVDVIFSDFDPSKDYHD
ncbi:MAG: BatD family protein, partial [Ginsengibacter sp.]